MQTRTFRAALVILALFATCFAHAPLARAATEVVASGYNSDGQATVSPNLANAAAVAAGQYHSLALRSDGTLAGWGNNDSGQLNAPADVASWIAIAARATHSVGVTAGGTVRVWGRSSMAPELLNPPADLNGVTAVAASPIHILALRSDGTVTAWGGGGLGQAVVPGDLTDVVAIAANTYNSMALKSDGTVVVWGYPSASVATLPPGLAGVTAISLGDGHALAVRSDGTVAAWGDNYRGETDVPAGLSNVVAVAAGSSSSFALKADGTVVAWGSNYFGQLDLAPNLADTLALDAGSNHTLAVRSRTNDVAPSFVGQPANTTVNEGQAAQFVVATAAHPIPYYRWQRRQAGASEWNDLSDTGGFSGTATATLTVATTLALQNSAFRCLATNAEGSATSNLAVLALRPKPVITPVSVKRQLGVRGQPLTLSATVAGTGTVTYQWRRNGLDLDGAHAATLTLASFNPRADTGYYQLLATDSNGTSRCTFFVLPSPVATAGLRAWGAPILTAPPADHASIIAVASEGDRALGLRADGTVEHWGQYYGTFDKLPDNLTDVVAVSVGEFHGAALRADGTVAFWGIDGYFISAADVAALRDVVALSSGPFHLLALKGDGTVVALGNNSNNELAMPTGLAEVIGVAAGYYQSLAVKRDGTVVGWGREYEGSMKVPATLANVQAVAAGYGQGFALKRDGTVVGWGWPSFSATPPVGLANVVALSTYYQHIVALRADGTVACWGSSYDGATAAPSGLADIVAINAGAMASFAVSFSPTLPPTIVGQPQPASGVTGEGTPITFSVLANGTPAPDYRWQRKAADGYVWTNLADNADYSGTGTSALRVLSPTLPMSGDRFRCTVSNSQGSVTTELATMAVKSNYATFRRLNFNVEERANALVSGPAADSDGDGLVNWLEYALARNPKVADAGSAVTIALDVGYLAATVDRPRDVIDLAYHVEASANLVDWTDVTGSVVVIALTPVSPSVERLTVRETTLAGPRRFLRLRVDAQ